jgi:hypothetical protein
MPASSARLHSSTLGQCSMARQRLRPPWSTPWSSVTRWSINALIKRTREAATIPSSAPSVADALLIAVYSGAFEHADVADTNAIESRTARYWRAVRVRGRSPAEQAAMKCLYLVARSLDPPTSAGSDGRSGGSQPSTRSPSPSPTAASSGNLLTKTTGNTVAITDLPGLDLRLTGCRS